MPLRTRTVMERITLVVVLPSVAGSINAAGLLEVGVPTSHMTGTVSQIGEQLALGNLATTGFALGLVTAFFCGATVAALLVKSERADTTSRYAAACLIEVVALALFGLICSVKGWRAAAPPVLVTGLLSFAMGLQNALVTRISNAAVRTTHVTGIITDVAVELVRVVRLLRQGLAVRTDPEYLKLELHVAIFVSFLAGATLGPLGFQHFGYGWLLAPIAVLLALAALDVGRLVAGEPSVEMAARPALGTPVKPA